jgi:hypothetical protein
VDAPYPDAADQDQFSKGIFQSTQRQSNSGVKMFRYFGLCGWMSYPFLRMKKMKNSIYSSESILFNRRSFIATTENTVLCVNTKLWQYLVHTLEQGYIVCTSRSDIALCAATCTAFADFTKSRAAVSVIAGPPFQ